MKKSNLWKKEDLTELYVRQGLETVNLLEKTNRFGRHDYRINLIAGKVAAVRKQPAGRAL